MANSVTQTTLVGSGSDKRIVRRIHIVSDGSEETDLVVYDNSTFINDVNKGRLDYIYCMGDSATLRLEWDAGTDVPIISVNSSNDNFYDFLTKFGGFSNPGGSGATGDILLTTANLDSGDEVTLILGISQN